VNLVSNDDGNAPLHIAAEMGHLECLNILLLHRAAIDQKASNGTNPLHIASVNGFVEIARSLCQKGADVNAVSPIGMAAMDYAEHGRSKDFEKWQTSQISFSFNTQPDPSLMLKWDSTCDILDEYGSGNRG